MKENKVDFGQLIFQLRTSQGYTLKKVSEKLKIDISLLSKIEHGERQIQGHMLKKLARIFDLDYEQLQMDYLHTKIIEEYGREPFFKEAIQQLAKKIKKK